MLLEPHTIIIVFSQQPETKDVFALLSVLCGGAEMIEKFKDRSPFANFLVELKSSDYFACKQLPTEAEQKECKYELRKKIKSISKTFSKVTLTSSGVMVRESMASFGSRTTLTDGDITERSGH